MASIARRGALAVLAGGLLLTSSGLGLAAPRAAHPRATLDPSLRHVVEAASIGGSKAAVQVIVTGWNKNALKVLDSLRVRHRHLRALPMAFAKLTPRQIVRLLGTNGIRSVYGEQKFELYLNESAELIGARYAAEKLKVDGTGATIAVIDTGVDTTHMDLPLGTKVVKNYEVVAPNVNDPGAPLLVESPNTDDNEHGTHVAGTIAGSGELARTDPDYAGRDLRGIAPGAKLIGYSANQGPSLLSTHTIAAFDHIIATAGLTGVRAISNSWGGSDGSDFDANGPIGVAQEAAWKAGIVPVFAAGNSGNPGDTSADGENTLSGQCVSPYVVCVAAMTKHRQVVTFSSKGRPNGNWDRALAQRFRTGLYRPTVTAPGVNITAPAAAASTDGDKPLGYLTISGTSMSTPEVSGVVALIASANPKLTPAQIVKILESTADPLPGWNAHEDGAGAVNARRAVEAALALKAGRDPRLATPKLAYAPPASAAKVLATFQGTALPASYLHHNGVTDHTFTVPPGTERFDLQLSWSTQAENLYAFIWEPGVTPAESPSGAPFASQESWGLLCDGVTSVPCMLTGRRASIRYPKPGTWTLRVYGRTIATSYEAVINAKTFSLPVTTAEAVAGVVRGKAAFPAASSAATTRAGIPGTELVVKNPTEKPLRVYFHEGVPVAGLDVDWPSWDTTEPSAGAPDVSVGAGGSFVPHRFEGVVSHDLQGDLLVDFWAGSAGGVAILGTWDVEILEIRGDQEIPIASGGVSGTGLGEVPTQQIVRVPNVRIAKGTRIAIVIDPRFIDSGSHSMIYFDSADFPSGLVLPTVAKLSGTGALAVPDVAIADMLGEGAATLSWSRVEGATGYRVYQGSSPDALAPAYRLAQPAKKAAAKAIKGAPLVVEGVILAGNPSNGLATGVTEAEFLLTCPNEPSTQALDGYVFPIPAEASDGKQTITVTGSSDLPYDLDVHLFDENCDPITGNEGDLATGDPDETGIVTAGARYVLVAEFLGGPLSFTAEVTRGATGGAVAAPAVAKVSKTVSGLQADRPAYFRVAAIDASGKEGPPSLVFAARPSLFERSVEVSVDNGPWVSVPVAGDGSWSAPLSRFGVAAAASGSHTVRVRPRAGEAVGALKTLTAAGAFRPVTGGAPLPATGVGGLGLGAGLLGVASALALRIRRRRD